MMTKNFSRSEFECECGCGEDRISSDLIECLQLARDSFGRGITINSGCRCPQRNKEVGGSSTSSHLLKTRDVNGNGWSGGVQETCVAADLKATNSKDRFQLISVLIESGIRRIGIGKDFLHVDIDPEKDKEVAWLYS